MHIIKLHAGDVNAVLGESAREHHSKVGSIDPERTHLNKNLCQNERIFKADDIKEKIKALGVKRKIKDDAVIACSCIIDIPKNYRGDPEAFMKSAYKTLKEMLCDGKEDRVLQADWHRDEKTDHMHFSWLPVIEKDGKKKLSAKDQITKDFLRNFHKEVSQRMSNDLGMEIMLYDEEKCEERRKKRLEGDRSADYVSLEQYKAQKEREGVLECLKNEIEEMDTIKDMNEREIFSQDEQKDANNEMILQQIQEITNNNTTLSQIQDNIKQKTEELTKIDAKIEEKQTIWAHLDRALRETIPRFINAYRAVSRLLDHWFNVEKPVYLEVCRQIAPMVNKGKRGMEMIDNAKNEIIFGSGSKAVKDSLMSGIRAVEEAADELEDIEDEKTL